MDPISLVVDGVDKSEAMFGSAIGNLDKLEGAAGKAGAVIAAGFKAAAVVSAAALTAVVTGAGLAVNATREWANQLDSMADVLGTTAQQSAAMAVAITNVGGNVDALGTQFTFMARGLETAKGELGPVGKELQSLGINVYDTKGQLKDVPAILEAVSSRFARMPDGIEKSAEMTRVFGRSGKDLSDVLSEMADGGLARADAQARKYGLSLSDGAVAQSKAFDRTLAQLQMTLQGFGVVVGTAILPTMQKFGDTLLTTLNSPEIRGGIDALAKGFANLGKFVTGAVDSIMGTFKSSGWEGVGKLFWVWITGSQGVLATAGAMLGNVAKIIGDKLAAVWPDIQKQLLAWGGQFWGWLTDLVVNQVPVRIGTFAASVSAEVSKRWPEVEVQLRKWGDAAWNWITLTAKPLAETKIGEFATAVGSYIQQKWPEVEGKLRAWGDAAWNWVKDTALPALGDKMGQLLKGISEWVNSPGTQADLKKSAEVMGDTIGRFFKDLLSDEKKSNETLDSWMAALDKSVPSIVESLQTIGGTVGKGLVDGMGKQLTDVDWGKVAEQMLTHLGNSIVKHYQIGWDAATNLGGELVKKMGEVDWSKVGGDIVLGIVNGLNRWNGFLVNTMKDLAMKALGAAKDALLSHSPSMLFADEVGKPIVEGWALGITKNSGLVLDALRGVAKQGLAWSRDSSSFMAAFGQSPAYAVNIMSQYAWARNAAIAADPFYTDPVAPRRDDSAYAGMQQATGKPGRGDTYYVMNVYTSEPAKPIQDFQTLKAMAS